MRIFGTFWIVVIFFGIELWFLRFWKSILFWRSVKAYDQDWYANDGQHNKTNKNID